MPDKRLPASSIYSLGFTSRFFLIRKIHSDPGFQSDSTLRPKKYGKDILEDKREFHTPTKMISRVSGAQTSLALRKGDYELYKLRELVRMNLASNLYGETQWLPARYVKAKRSAVHNVREQERKEAANVNIAVELERERE